MMQTHCLLHAVDDDDTFEPAARQKVSKKEKVRNAVEKVKKLDAQQVCD